ncbi:hypothetical protein [Symbioplanes lichenis]|uniref:hypothetical protein n=1 Tax=Symbioplanes lichenis TaxID=1629072 RepID=UPI0027381D35|nr:hypothetical protein [Actinoplanes lichenis]
MPQHAHTRPAAPAVRSAAPPARPAQQGPQALLALQRQVGNSAVNQIIARAPEEVDAALAQQIAADPTFAAIVQESLRIMDEDSGTPAPPPAPIRTPPPIPDPPQVHEESPPVVEEPAPVVEEDVTANMPGAWPSGGLNRDGDKWKERGAAAASLAFGLGAGATYTTLKAVPLGGTATIVNASTAFGDFMSEQRKPVPPLTKPEPNLEAAEPPKKTDNRNMPKYVGSGTVLAGALTNGIGFLANRPRLRRGHRSNGQHDGERRHNSSRRRDGSGRRCRSFAGSSRPRGIRGGRPLWL